MTLCNMCAHVARGAVAAVLALALGLAVSTISTANDLTPSEMRTSRGSSLEVCVYEESCNTWNHYNAMCAGQPDGTACVSCLNGSNQVNYLDQVTDNCPPPIAPGFTYDLSQLSDPGCGDAYSGQCTGGVCATNDTDNGPCSVPYQIVGQSH